jgi:hypothetical protein
MASICRDEHVLKKCCLHRRPDEVEKLDCPSVVLRSTLHDYLAALRSTGTGTVHLLRVRT